MELLNISIDQGISIGIDNTETQQIGVTQEPYQTISIDVTNDEQSIVVAQEELQDIKVSLPSCDCKADIQVAIDQMVPKRLSILPEGTIEQIDTDEKRSNSRVYVDVNGVAHHFTLVQVKELSTKTLFVESMNDERIKALSSEDIIMLKEG